MNTPGYELALREWGARKLEKAAEDAFYWPVGVSPLIDRETVTVRFDFNAGYTCCGGTSPDCYCSGAESPTAGVVIEGRTVEGRHRDMSIDPDRFDFVQVLGELTAIEVESHG